MDLYISEGTGLHEDNPWIPCFGCAYLSNFLSVLLLPCYSPPASLLSFPECALFLHTSIFLHLFFVCHMLFFIIIIINYCISFKIKIIFYLLSESLLSLSNLKQSVPLGPLCIFFIRFIMLKSEYFLPCLSVLRDCKQF